MSAIYPSLQNKTVLVTGGAEGIGAATVELFCRQGSKVLFLDISHSSAATLIASLTAEAEAQRKSTTSSTTGGLTFQYPPISIPQFYHCDVSDIQQLQSVASQILAEHHVVHILVNNAAVAGGSSRMDTFATTPEAWEFGLNVNLRHIFFLTQYLVPAMRDYMATTATSSDSTDPLHDAGCSIINMGSITWRIPAAGLPVYTLAKAAIMGLTKTHSKEFGPWGIRVNSVMPGAIATERQVREVLTPEYRAEVMAAQTLQRDLRPAEVGRVVLFLASAEASAVTGSSYVVDGGWVSDP